MDILSSLLGRSGYLPHGYCFTWTPGLLWSMVSADTVIALAYFSIPLAIGSFVRQRADVPMKGIAWLFGAFIFACGITHVMDVWTVWLPDYSLQALSKLVTAALSLITAVALWRLIPKALKIPSVQQLQAVIGSLEAEVSQRRSVEAHLVDVQQSLALTLASIGAGFIATDRDGRVTRMNAVAEQVLGWNEADACGQRYWDVLLREGRPADFTAQNPVDLLVEQRITVEQVHEVVVVARDGRRTPLELHAAPTHGSDDTVRGMAVVFRDTTRLNQAEAASSRLAALVESSDDAIISKTLDGRITSWNVGAQALFGYSAEEAVGQPVQMLIPPDRQGEEMRILAELSHGARVPAFDTVRRAKGGRLLDVSVTISPIRDQRGRIVGASKIARDVSVQRRAAAALRDSEARLRFTLEAAQIGDWELDLVSGVARRSLRHDRCFGYDAPLPHWTKETFAEHVHPDDRAGALLALHTAVADRHDLHLDCRVVWPDGSLHWISVDGSLQFDGDLPTRMLGIVIDATQQRLAESARLTAERLAAENRQIQEASRLKSQFLANMSHELRTPLNAIIGFADLLHAGSVPEASPKRLQFLGHIGTSGRHLLQLINDVLDLSKVESGKFEFFPEAVDLRLLVKEASDILHTATVGKRIELVTDIDPVLSGLVLDPARLKQVLYNYLSNAIKFTPDGGRVTVRARPEGEWHFRLEVEDSGIGIAEADLPRLFSEFQQLDAGYSKQHPGTGLGLALTRRLVQAQGGSVGVRSTVGVGSVFHLVLARRPLPPGLAVALPRWLLIEADDADRAQLVQGLSDAGIAADVASTGMQALQQASLRPYDAITLELRLPDLGAFGVLASIRSNGPSRSAPVCGVTVQSSAGTAAAAFAIADVLAKPICSEEILSAMARLRGNEPGRFQVMVIDDDPLARDVMHATLKSIGIDSTGFADGRQALRQIDQQGPGAIILDLMMPGFDGFEVLDALGRLPRWRETPVFIWTSMLLTDGEYESLARSARAVLSKGGGAMATMLLQLRHRRSPVAALPEGRAT